jgi:hypothetical protein
MNSSPCNQSNLRIPTVTNEDEVFKINMGTLVIDIIRGKGKTHIATRYKHLCGNVPMNGIGWKKNFYHRVVSGNHSDAIALSLSIFL